MKDNSLAKPNKKRFRLAEWVSFGKVDVPFLLLVLGLLGFGLIMLTSSSYVVSYYDHNGDSYAIIKQQLLAAVIGGVAMIAMTLFDYHKLRKFSAPLLVISVVMLIVVLLHIPGIAVKANGAWRWIRLGIQFQPSEVAKFAMILSMASYISANYKSMDKFKVGFLPLVSMLFIIVGLVLVETHLSGAIIIFVVGMVLLFVGGVKLRYYFATLAGCGVIFGAIAMFTDYMKERITTWLNPYEHPTGAGYQIIQSLYAIGSGGLLGLGFGQSRQKHLYLPENENDYIFSVICEELGFVGALLVILLFVMLIWRGFYIALNSRDKFGSLLVIGITCNVAVQTILNIAVVTNAIPSTGIGLPFFSAGGSSLLIMMAEMGVVLSVSKYSYSEKV